MVFYIIVGCLGKSAGEDVGVEGGKGAGGDVIVGGGCFAEEKGHCAGYEVGG